MSSRQGWAAVLPCALQPACWGYSWGMGFSVPSMGEGFNRSGMWENPPLAGSESVLWMRTRVGQGSIPLSVIPCFSCTSAASVVGAGGDIVAAPLGRTLAHAHATATYASCRQTWSVCQWSWASRSKNTPVACSVSNPQQRDLLGSPPSSCSGPVRLAGMRGAHRTWVTSLGHMDVLVRVPVRRD